MLEYLPANVIRELKELYPQKSEVHSFLADTVEFHDLWDTPPSEELENNPLEGGRNFCTPALSLEATI